MRRIYSNYSDEEFEMITDMAKEQGFSLSSFQHYCVMLYADSRGNTSSTDNLISEMFKEMQKVNIGATFIVSALLPEVWLTLTRSVKMTLAKQLSINVKNNPKFEKFKVTEGKTTVYKRIG